MENVLRLVHRAGLDVTSRLDRTTYRRILSDIDFQTRRIGACLEMVDSSDGCGVHLDFCFTGIGRNYYCAIWPRHQAKVGYHFRSPYDITVLSRSKWNASVRHDDDPAVVEFDGSTVASRTPHFRRYQFFSESPFQPHRPYFLKGCDPLLSRDGQVDAKVVAYHSPDLQAKWKDICAEFEARRGVVDDAFARPDIGSLLALRDVVRDFSLHDLPSSSDKLTRS